MIEKDSRLKSVFPNCPRIAYTRPKNLKEVLSPTRLPKIKKKIDTRKPKPGFQRCPDKTCGMCPFTANAADGNGLVKEVVIRHTGQVIPIKEKLSCFSQNCLYICTCISTVCTSKIGKGQYKGQCIGQTERKVRDRWMEHKRSIQDPETVKPVGLHHQERGHRGPEDCTITLCGHHLLCHQLLSIT